MPEILCCLSKDTSLQNRFALLQNKYRSIELPRFQPAKFNAPALSSRHTIMPLTFLYDLLIPVFNVQIFTIWNCLKQLNNLLIPPNKHFSLKRMVYAFGFKTYMAIQDMGLHTSITVQELSNKHLNISLWMNILRNYVENLKDHYFRRRTLKNRGYAASCRIKRLEQKDELEGEKGKEIDDLDKLQVEIQV